MSTVRAALAILAIAIGLSTSATRATASWMETFTGGFDQSWTFLYNAPPSDTTVSTAGDKLTLQDNLTLTPDESVAGLVLEEFTDVRVRATVIPMMGNLTGGAPAATNNDVFVAARSNGIEAYLLSLDFDDGDVDLVRVDNVGDLHGLANINNPAWFAAGTSYQLDLRVLGNELHGRVLDLDGNILDTLTAMDTNLLAGRSGIGAAMNADFLPGNIANMTRIAAMFDDVSSTAVPEPSTLFLSGLAVLGASLYIRRKT